MLPLCSLLFFFNDTATTEIYTLSLHDALPISFLWVLLQERLGRTLSASSTGANQSSPPSNISNIVILALASASSSFQRSEEHTSELQSHLNLVCRLLLEKKKTKRLTQ